MAVYPSIFRSLSCKKWWINVIFKCVCMFEVLAEKQREASFLGPWRQKVCLQSRCTRILRFQHRPALSWVPVAWIAETFSTSMFFWDIKLMHWKWWDLVYVLKSPGLTELIEFRSKVTYMAIFGKHDLLNLFAIAIAVDPRKSLEVGELWLKLAGCCIQEMTSHPICRGRWVQKSELPFPQPDPGTFESDMLLMIRIQDVKFKGTGTGGSGMNKKSLERRPQGDDHVFSKKENSELRPEAVHLESTLPE